MSIRQKLAAFALPVGIVTDRRLLLAALPQQDLTGHVSSVAPTVYTPSAR